MLGFIALVLINAVLFFVNALLIKSPTFPDASPDSPDGPRSQEGDVLPVVFGTVRISANCTMFQDTLAREEKEKVKTGLFSSRNITTGYSYEAVMQVALCHGPIDALLDVVWQDSKTIAGFTDSTDYQAVTTEDGLAYMPVSLSKRYVTPSIPMEFDDNKYGTTFDVEAPNLFGGYQHGGGVIGPMRLHWGQLDQLSDPSMNTYVATQMLALLYGPDWMNQNLTQAEIDAAAVGKPRWGGVCWVMLGANGLGVNFKEDAAPDPLYDDGVYKRFNFGEFGNVPDLYFVVRRCPNSLGVAPEVANIGGSANPACCIYEALTDAIWGSAVPPDQIDVASFQAAAQTLADEGFGFNQSLTSQQTGDAIAQEILRYIDGQVQQHPVTGLIQLTLNRADYVVADLPVVDESACTKATFSRPSWSELVNQISVKYTRLVPGNFKEAVTQPVTDIAAQRNFGVVNAVTMEYPGIFDPVLANKLALRDLRRQASPLGQAKSLQLDRRAADWVIGMPFTFQWAKYGIAGHTFRVAAIEYGDSNSPTIMVDAIEDVFGLEDPAYGTPVSNMDLIPASFGSLDVLSVVPEVTSTGAIGQLTLTLTGGGGKVTHVQFRVSSGVSPMSDWADNTSPDGFIQTVVLDPKYTSHIGWRVLGTLADGTEGTLIDGEVELPISTVASRPILSYQLDISSGHVDALVDVTPDIVSIKVAGSKTVVPDLTTVRATAPIAVPFGTTRVVVPAVLTLLPAERGYLSAIGIDANGNESALVSTPVGFPVAALQPTIELVYATPNPLTGLVDDVAFRINSPRNLGGTLTVWLNRGVPESATWDAAPDGHIVLGVTPTVVDEHSVFVIGAGPATAPILDNVRVHPSQGKIVFAEFVDSNGVSSGQMSFTLRGGGGVIDENGNLKDASVIAASQFAGTVKPLEAYAEPLPVRPAGTFAVDLTTGRMQQSNGTGWTDAISAPNLAGLLTGAQIASQTIGFTNIQGNASLPQVVATLAAANPAVSLLALNQADGLLYRWNGLAWTNNTPATDISGTIIGAQLASGVIDQTKVASGLRLPGYGSSLPGTGQLGDTFVLTGNSLVYRWNGSGWTADIPAVIISGMIATTQITPGSITTPLLASNSITTDKLSVYGGQGAALNSDPNTSDQSAWVIDLGPGVINLGVGGKAGGWALTSGNGGQGYYRSRRFMQLDFTSKTYRVHGWVYNGDSNGILYLGLYLLDGNQQVLTGAYALATAGVTPPNEAWTEYIGYLDAARISQYGISDPSQPKYAQAYALLNYLGTTGFVYLQDFRIEEVMPGTLIKDGAITTAKLTVGSVTAGQIAAGAVIAGTVAAHAIGVEELAAGAVTAEKLSIGMQNSSGALNADPTTSEPSNWTDDYIGGGPPLRINFGPGGKTGQYALGSGVSTYAAYLTGKERIPIDPNKRYRVRAWVYNDQGNGYLYLGVRAFDGNGVSQSSPIGGGYYTTVQAAPVSGVWTEYIGYVGINTPLVMSTSPGPFPSDVKTMAPYALLNYLGTNGQMYVQDFRVEEVLPGTLIQDGVITTEKIAVGAIRAGQVFAGAIQAGALQTNSVIAGNIDAGVVTAREILSGSITTDRLLVTGGTGAALNSDPETKDATAWKLDDGAAAAVIATITDGKTGTTTLRSSVGSWAFVSDKTWFTVDPTKVYRCRCWVRRTADAPGTIYYGVRGRDGSGGAVNGNDGLMYMPGSGTAPTPNVWTEMVGYAAVGGLYGATMSPTTARVQMILLMNYATTGGTGYYEVQDYRFEEVMPGTLIQSGAITTDKMTANTINGDRITAGTLDALKINAGTVSAATALITNLQASVVTAAVMKAKFVGTDKLQAAQIAVTSLQELSPNTGILVNGTLYNTAQNKYVNLNSDLTSSTYFLYTPLFYVRGDGYAYFNGDGVFTGTVYASAGTFTGAVTATSGTFTGTINASAGTFGGTVTSSAFTTSTASFSGQATFYSAVSIYAGGIGDYPAGALKFYDYNSAMRGRIWISSDGSTWNTINMWSTDSMQFFTDTGAMSFYPNQLFSVFSRMVVNKSSTQPGLSYAFGVQKDGTYITQFDFPPTTGDCGMMLLYRDDSTGALRLLQVKASGTNTAGSGFRALRIPN